METLQRTANRGSVSTGPYEIDNSLKMEADNSESMTRTPSSSGNRKTWTLSFWFKRTELGATERLFEAWDGSTGTSALFDTANKFLLDLTAGSNYFTSTAVFTDTSAWNHFVIRVDTTQGTASERARIYVNGSELAGSWNSNIGQNTDLTWNQNVVHYFGVFHNTGNFVSGYYAEVINVDGTSLAPTAFGEVDSASGIWIPIDASPTYGTNGFKLEFKSSGSLGADTSGNGHTWSLLNLTAVDQATDTPTNNFATFNVLQPRASGTTISKGGTDFYINSNYQTAVSSIAVSKGKWYAEFSCDSTTSFIGIVDVEDGYIPQNHTGYYLGYAGGNQNRSVGLRGSDGALLNRTGDFWGAAYSAGAIIGIGLNMDDRKINFSVNGTWMSSDNSGTPANGATWNTSSSLGDAWTDVITMGVTGYSNIHWKCNFGGYTDISISSGNSDANGYGNFEYAVPSGFYSLCTKNLAEFG